MPQFLNRDVYETTIQRELNRIHREANREMQAYFPRDLFGNLEYDRDEFLNAQPNWSEFLDNIRKLYKRELTPIVGFVYAESAENLELERAFSVADDVVRDSAEAWAQRWVDTLATDMTETNQRQIDKYIREYMDDPQQGLGRLKERLATIVSPSRADMVASTEITRANYEGEAFIVNQLRNEGVTLAAVWFTSNDERVCPVCGPRHNMMRGSAWQLPPPAHPRCRCWVNWIDPDEYDEYVSEQQPFGDEDVQIIETPTEATWQKLVYDEFDGSFQLETVRSSNAFYETKTLKELVDYALNNGSEYEVNELFNNGLLSLDANFNVVFEKQKLQQWAKDWVQCNRYSYEPKDYLLSNYLKAGLTMDEAELFANMEQANSIRAIRHLVDITNTKLTKAQEQRMQRVQNGGYLDMLFEVTGDNGTLMNKIKSDKKARDGVRRGLNRNSAEYRKAREDWDRQFNRG